MSDVDLEKRLNDIMEHPSYRLAFRDLDFLGLEDLRPLRLEMELLKPEMCLEEKNIKSTICVFGGTQILPKEEADQKMTDAKKAVEANSHDPEAQRLMVRAKNYVANVRFYDECREFARMVSEYAKVNNMPGEFVVKTGGGPGIMEAGNRGAFDANMPSIGLNIILPFEQTPNAYITPGLCFQFNYFAIRKMHFFVACRSAHLLSRRIWDVGRTVYSVDASSNDSISGDSNYPVWKRILAEHYQLPVSCRPGCDSR